MDIQRPDLSRKRRQRRLIWGASGLVVLIALFYGFSKLEPAAPEVDRETV
jgi:HlyD family secretion protein